MDTRAVSCARLATGESEVEPDHTHEHQASFPLPSILTTIGPEIHAGMKAYHFNLSPT